MGRATVLVVGLMVALTLVVVAGTLAPAPADAAQRKVVTRTFSSNGPITIEDSGSAAPYPSERTVAGFNRGRILDVNLSLKNFSHPAPPDVDVLLSKGNMGCTVMSDVGNEVDQPSDVDNITLLLDDEATNSLPEFGQLVSGRFKPTNAQGPDFFSPPVPERGFPALSGFDGLNPNGTWQLRVMDDTNGFSGQFAGGWTITIRAKVPR